MKNLFENNVNIKNLKNLSYKLVDNIKKRNLNGEISILIRNEFSTVIRLGKLETIENNTNKLVNLVLYNNLKKGISSSTNFEDGSLNSMIDVAFNISKYSQNDIYNGLPNNNFMAVKFPDLQTYNWKNINIKRLLKLLIDCEKKGLSYSKKIINSEGVNFSAIYSCKIYANTNNFFSYNLFTKYFLSCILIASDNNVMERDFDYTVSRDFDYLKINDISTNAACLAIKRLNSQKINTFKGSCLFTASMAGSLLSDFVIAISGKNLYRNNSFLLNYIDKKVFPEFISIKENPYIIKGFGSSSYDCEGIQTYEKYIVKNGILKSYLLDTYSAKKLNMVTTANAGGVYNLILESSVIHTFDDIVKTISKGIIIHELLGYGVNVINGDYSRGACGYYVENGHIKHSVNEITISGNLKNMYNNIVAIANDNDYRNNIVTGSILINDIIFGGK